MRSLQTLTLLLSTSLFAPLAQGVVPASVPAEPATAYVATPESTLGFVARYMGEEFQGHLQRFTPEIRFDPAWLGGSRFDVRIELASANTDNAERDALLLGGEFFNSTAMPQARYEATRFRALGGNRYVAEGHLTLRGIRKPVALTFTWTAGAPARLVGEATLNRLDFQVGTGDWTDTELLPNAVTVKTTLALMPASTP